MDQTSEHLTKREHEILELIVYGCTTKLIASKLGISIKTAAAHRANIMSKLGVHDTASLVRKAILSGLVVLQADKQLEGGCERIH